MSYWLYCCCINSVSMCVAWLLHQCDMTTSHDDLRLQHYCGCAVNPSDVWHGSFTCVTWLLHMCGMTIHMCDMTHSHVWHDSFTCVTWLILMCDMTHSHNMTLCVHVCDVTPSRVCHDSFTWRGSFMCVPWLIHMTWLLHVCAMTHSYDVAPSLVCHDSFTYYDTFTWHDSFIYHDTFAWHAPLALVRQHIDSVCMCVTWLLHVCAMNHSMSCDAFTQNAYHMTHSRDMHHWLYYADVARMRHMGWLRLVGSIKLQVSFVKEPYQRGYILQKRPIILRSLPIKATPYVNPWALVRQHI